MLELTQLSAERFSRWFRRHRPDVVVALEKEFLPWLAHLRKKVPADVGFARLSRPARRSGALPAASISRGHRGAIDLVTNQIFPHALGVPATRRMRLIEGRWIDGTTTRA